MSEAAAFDHADRGWMRRALALETGTSGRRNSFWIKPIRLRAYFTGPGLVSLNRAWMTGNSRKWWARAAASSELATASTSALTAAG